MSYPNADRSRTPESPEGGADISQLFVLIKERLHVVGICAFIGILAAAFHLQRLPRTYRATAVLQLEPKGHLLGFESENASNVSSEPGLQTVLEAFRSNILLKRAAEDMHLNEDPLFSKSPISIDQAAQALRGCIEVHQRRNTQLIDITAEHPVPETAEKLANGIAKSFIQFQIDQRTHGARVAMDFLLTEAERLKKRLQESEEAIQTYKESNDAASLEDRQDTVTATLKMQGNNLAEARSARIKLESDVADMERFGNAPELLLTILSVSQHPSVMSHRSQISELQSRLSTLRLRYTDRHPRVIEVRNQIATAEAALNEAVLQIPSVLRTDLERARATERNFETALKEQEKQALLLNRQSIHYKALARDMDTDRALYESILRRLKETDVASGVQISDLRVFENASYPNSPNQRKSLKIILIGLTTGTILGAAVVIGISVIEGTWRSVDEIETSTGLPVIASIPQLARNPNHGTVLQSVSDMQKDAYEAFRSLRTSLHLYARKQGKNCFLFTSALSDDGKTFCSVGYAATLAHQGVRTLLIDADLRSPSVEKAVLGSVGLQGLAEILEQGIPAEKVIVPTPIESLDLLPAGAVLPHACELLTRKGIQSVLNLARREYDCIVIDSAPVQSVSDALLLSESADSVCLVTRYACTQRKAFTRALRLLNEHGAPVEGIIFNGVPPSAIYSYYGVANSKHHAHT